MKGNNTISSEFEKDYFEGYYRGAVGSFTKDDLEMARRWFTAWIKMSEYNPDANTGAVVMGNYSGDSKGSIFYVSNAGLLSIRPHLGVDLKGRTNIPTGEWTHIATTLEGSNLKVYVNGEEDGSGTSAGYAGGNAKTFTIGKASWYDGSFFTGIIDEAGLFNKALSKDEVKSVMNAGLLGKAAVFSSGKLIFTWATIKAK